MRSKLCALFGFVLAFAAVLDAQVERASIIGNITDTTGAAMAGVEVAVTNEATNTSIRVTSDESGAYTAVNLIPGSYSINASRDRIQTGGLPELRAASGPKRPA